MLFDHLVYAPDPEPDLGPEFLSIQISPGALDFRAFCIRPKPGTCLDPENLSILILPGSGLFELSVYASNQELARALKI